MKSVLITGANSGIGFATTQPFLDNGFHVFAHYHSSNHRLLELKSQNFSLVQADFREIRQVVKMADECLASRGIIDVLVSCAGTTQAGVTDTELHGKLKGKTWKNG